MFRSRLSRETEFFELFRESANLIVEGAEAFTVLLTDLPNKENHARNIKDIEHRADHVTHRTIELLHKTFITPLDRDDIHLLISKMDDVLDFIDAAAQRIYYYDINETSEGMERLADVCVEAAKLINVAVQGLGNLKNPDGIFKTCIEINRLENDADQILRTATAKLFREEPDLRKLIKLKEVYELLETVTDRCEDVANIIEGIVLEYA